MQSLYASRPWQCLYFLPPTRARIVASHFFPCPHERRRGRRRIGRCGGERLVVVGVLVPDVADRWWLLDRLDILGGPHLHRQHDLHDVQLDAVEHVREEFEGFALVFLLRILLCVAAQVDSLAQVIEIREVIAPVLVESLQHEAALELAHELGTDQSFLAGVLRECGVDQSLAQRVVGDVGLALQPFGHRRPHLEFRRERRFQAGNVPLLLD